MAQSTGSVGSAQNYQRLVGTFGPGALAHEGLPQAAAAKPFSAVEVYNKVATLVAIAIATGAAAAIIQLPAGVGFVAMLLALGCAVGTMFAPRKAKVLAPAFAFLEGLALGTIGSYYAGAGNQGVVPMAIIGTSVVFALVLVAYRTGLVKVGPTFAKATLIAGIGLVVMMLLNIFGLNLPFTSSATSSLIIFGYLYLVVAVMDLFVDFAYVDEAQRAGVDAEGEWFAAMSIMLSLVMVYLALLNILGRR